jgi:hypothetical protein
MVAVMTSSLIEPVRLAFLVQGSVGALLGVSHVVVPGRGQYRDAVRLGGFCEAVLGLVLAACSIGLTMDFRSPRFMLLTASSIGLMYSTRQAISLKLRECRDSGEEDDVPRWVMPFYLRYLLIAIRSLTHRGPR